MSIALRTPLYSGRRFLPSMLPNLFLWLNASQISGLNDGDPVASWSDLSGQGYTVSQGTGSKRPTYKTSIVNNRPVVRTDGVDDVLAATLPAVLEVSSYTYFVVANVTSSAGTKCLLEMGDVAVADQVMLVTGADVLRWVAYEVTGGANDAPSSVATVAGSFKVLTGRRSVAEGSVLNRINGTQDGIDASLAGAVAGYGTAKVLAVGARTNTQFAPADIAEIVGYTRALSLSEMAKVERYLGAKYALAVA